MPAPHEPVVILDETGSQVGVVDHVFGSPRSLRVVGWSRRVAEPPIRLWTSVHDDVAPSVVVRFARGDVLQAGAADLLDSGFQADFALETDERPTRLQVGSGDPVRLVEADGTVDPDASSTDGYLRIEASGAGAVGPDAGIESARLRRQKLLGTIDIATMTGVEIGALNRPVVKKTEGTIFYVDYADAPYLRDRYRNDPNVDVEQIVEVDGIWGRDTLVECLGDTAPVDYIVASHVIEHVPDLVTWLMELRSILKPSGRVCLAIPDRRYSFDFHRNETGIAEVLNNYYFRRRVPTVQQVMDHILTLVPVDTAQLWNHQEPPRSVIDRQMLQGVMRLAEDITQNGTYHDVHCWVFTPHSLSLLFIALAQVELLAFECETFHDTAENELEFFVTLKLSDDRQSTVESWLRVVEQCRSGESRPRSAQ